MAKLSLDFSVLSSARSLTVMLCSIRLFVHDSQSYVLLDDSVVKNELPFIRISVK